MTNDDVTPASNRDRSGCHGWNHGVVTPLTRHDTTRHTRIRLSCFHGFTRTRLPMKTRTHTDRSMNQTEAGELLRARRELTGGTYNEETVKAWHHALADQDYDACRTALFEVARNERRITVAHVVERLPRRANGTTHSTSCICAGRGWLETEQHDDRHSWTVWTRCPNGPATAFVEIDA